MVDGKNQCKLCALENDGCKKCKSRAKCDECFEEDTDLVGNNCVCKGIKNQVYSAFSQKCYCAVGTYPEDNVCVNTP